MQPSILSGIRAGYVNRFYPADLPQQNSKTTNTRTLVKYKNSSGDEIANVNFYAMRPGSYRNSLK